MRKILKDISQTSVIYKLTFRLPHHPLFRVTHFSLKISKTYNFTVGASRLLGNSFHPSLNPIRPLSILAHFLECLSRILRLASSRNLQLLVIISCAHHLLTSFKVCNDQGLMIKVHHETTIQIIINKKKARRDSHIDYRYTTCPETCIKYISR
jgi:hypothetical protein